MKVLILGLSVAMSLVSINASAYQRVRGYEKRDGTYVNPYYRSEPDSNPYNNLNPPHDLRYEIKPIEPINPYKNPYETR